MTASQPLRYLIRTPKEAQDQYPAIILLHGYGSNAEDLFSFTPYLPQDHVIISLEAPHPLPQMGSAWYAIHFEASQDRWTDVPQAKDSMALVMENMELLIQKHHLNPRDLTLLGFSQGAILSWALAFNHPLYFRRIVALSGYVNQDLIEQQEVTFLAFASHGKADPVIPFVWAEKSIAPLVAANSTIRFEAFESGHTVSQENFLALLEWLKETTLG